MDITLLYSPADRPDRVAKALASGADVVLIDLEDAVAPSRKSAARDAVSQLARTLEGRRVQVRINGLDTPWWEEDVALVGSLPEHVGVRVPKVEHVREVEELHVRFPARGLHLLLESAMGVERAFELASASPAVASVGLGEADLRSDLGLSDDAGLQWARSRTVVACRAAGLPAPAMSVYPALGDLDGLRASCVEGRRLGFVGRAAIHPTQLAPIRAAFRPAAEDVERARAVLGAVSGAHAAGSGTAVLDDRTFVDAAMVRAARRTVALWEATG